MVRIDCAWSHQIGWRGWLSSVVKPDGSYDDTREPSMHDTLDDARERGREWADILGLPFVEGDSDPPKGRRLAYAGGPTVTRLTPPNGPGEA